MNKEETLKLIDEYEKNILSYISSLDNDYYLGSHGNKTGDLEINHRWLSIAKTDIEKGFMALRRSVCGDEYKAKYKE